MFHETRPSRQRLKIPMEVKQSLLTEDVEIYADCLINTRLTGVPWTPPAPEPAREEEEEEEQGGEEEGALAGKFFGREAHSLFHRGSFADFGICTTGGFRYPCHRFLLAGCSPVFRGMLASGPSGAGGAFDEAISGQVTLEEADPATVEKFLGLLYGFAAPSQARHCDCDETRGEIPLGVPS